jgi:hypothetical protein
VGFATLEIGFVPFVDGQRPEIPTQTTSASTTQLNIHAHHLVCERALVGMSLHLQMFEDDSGELFYCTSWILIAHTHHLPILVRKILYIYICLEHL